MLDCALQRAGRVLYASTSEVYGDPATTPQPESYMGNVNTWGPRACYDESKRLGETLCYEYRRIYKTDVRVARIFNTYGPRMDPQDGRVVSNFLTQALAGKPLTVYGDGSQTRSFCYASDMVEALVRLMEVEPAPDGPVNLGNPMEFSISELGAMVGVVVDKPCWIECKPLPQDDPKQRRPDITKARALLGWEPKVRLLDGLAKTARYLQTIDTCTDDPLRGRGHGLLYRQAQPL